MFRLKSDNVEVTRAIAGAIADVVEAGDVLILAGDLGTGKTAFTQGFGAALGVEQRITSPTFTLVHEYVGRLDIHHVDVYRLSHIGEIFDLALPELLDDDGVTIIEWGDLILSEIPRDYLELEIALGELSEGFDVRRMRLELVGPGWSRREQAVASAVSPWIDGLN